MRRTAVLGTVLGLLLLWAWWTPAPALHRSTISGARVTYFSLSGVMASGAWVYEGAAACGAAYPWLGSVTIHAAIDVVVQCVDRGYLGYDQVDIWSGWGRPWWLQADYYDVEF